MAPNRPSLAAVAAAVIASFALNHTAPAAAPTPIDKAITFQATLAQARDLLTANQTAEAVDLLERQLASADGNRAYLDLLGSAYIARIKRLHVTNGSPDEISNLQTKLGLLGVAVPDESVAAATPPPAPAPTFTPPVGLAPPAPTPVPAVSPTPEPQADASSNLLGEAAALFNQASADPAKFEVAARMFAAAFGGREEMRPDQLAAWAYCRVRVAADRLNGPSATPAVAAEVAREVEAAMKLAPDNAGLQQVGRDLLAAARQRAGSAAASTAATADGWDVVETASFRVRHRGNRALADAVAAAAEAKRNDIFVRWSGPAGGPWAPKCEITLHPSAAVFAEATAQHPTATGRATVRIEDGRVTDRRVDLRADDATTADDALPRELTHLILADLFPTTAPPRWAVEGMAVLAASAVEVDRYLRTLPRCREAGEFIPVATLLTMSAPPAEKVTGYYVGSVSLVEFLVRWKGDKAFTTFLRDSQRYGVEAAMKRQYGVADAGQLEAVWLRDSSSAVSARVPTH